MAAAATVGTTLGHLANRVETWDKQRAELIEEVQRMVAHGQDILKRLGHNGKATDSGTSDTSDRAPAHFTAPESEAASHRANPTARHDVSVLAKAQHATERTRPRTAFRSQNR